MGTFIAAACLAAAVGLAIRKMYKNKKCGKTSCGCSSGSCGSCTLCKGERKDDNV